MTIIVNNVNILVSIANEIIVTNAYLNLLSKSIKN